MTFLLSCKLLDILDLCNLTDQDNKDKAPYSSVQFISYVNVNTDR